VRAAAEEQACAGITCDKHRLGWQHRPCAIAVRIARAPADDIASSCAYYEVLVSMWTAAGAPSSAPAEAVEAMRLDAYKRAVRLRRPRNLVALLSAFTDRRKRSPELWALAAARLLSGGAAGINELTAHQLGTLAHAAVAQAGAAGAKPMLEAVAARAKALGELDVASHANVSAALAAAGMASLPVEVRIAAEGAGVAAGGSGDAAALR